MKMVYHSMQNHIMVNPGCITSVVVENPDYYYEMLWNLARQIKGEAGDWVISEDDVPQSVNKKIELIKDMVDFEINKKALLTKIISSCEKTALDEIHIDKTMQLLASIEQYMEMLRENYDIDLNYDKITIAQLLKTVGITINMSSDKPLEILYSYMKLVREFVGEKIFVFVNLRSFVSAHDFSEFVRTITYHGYQVVFFENKEYPRVQDENRIIIDYDLCEI